MILSIGRLYSFLELSLIILNKPLEYLISGDNLNKGKNKSAPKPISKEMSNALNSRISFPASSLFFAPISRLGFILGVMSLNQKDSIC